MNAKIIVALCALQLAAGLSVSDIIGGGKEALKDIVTQAQNVIGSFQEESASSLSQIADDAAAKLDEIVAKVNDEIVDKYSGVSGALPIIKACLETQKDNVSEIVESAKQKVQTFILKESLVVLPFVGKANATLNELKALVEKVGSQLQACAEEHPLEVPICVLSVVSKANPQVEEIVSDIKAEIEQAKQILEKVIRDGKAAVESFVESAKQSVEDIKAEAEECIRDSLQQS